MNTTKIIEICRAKGVLFVNRSHGLATNSTVSLGTMTQIIEEAIAQDRKEQSETLGNISTCLDEAYQRTDNTPK